MIIRKYVLIMVSSDASQVYLYEAISGIAMTWDSLIEAVEAKDKLRKAYPEMKIEISFIEVQF